MVKDTILITDILFCPVCGRNVKAKQYDEGVEYTCQNPECFFSISGRPGIEEQIRGMFHTKQFTILPGDTFKVDGKRYQVVKMDDETGHMELVPLD